MFLITIVNKSPSGWLQFVKALRWVWFLNNCSKYNHHFSFNEKNETKETYIWSSWRYPGVREKI